MDRRGMMAKRMNRIEFDAMVDLVDSRVALALSLQGHGNDEGRIKARHRDAEDAKEQARILMRVRD